MQITNLIMPKSQYVIKCPYAMIPEFVIAHETANDASAMAEASYMEGNANYVSFHEVVDDYRVVHCIDFNLNSFNAGDGRNGAGNRKGIAIEICYSKSGGERYEKARINGAKRIAQILKQFGWGIDKLKKHQDFSGKYCPHRTLDEGWDKFVNMVREELGDTIVAEKPTIQNKKIDVKYQVYSNGKWLPDIINTQDYAGIKGQAISGFRGNTVRQRGRSRKTYILCRIAKWFLVRRNN